MNVTKRKRVGNTLLAAMLIGAIAGISYGFANTVVEGSRIGWRSVLLFEGTVVFLAAAIFIGINLSSGLPWHGRTE